MRKCHQFIIWTCVATVISAGTPSLLHADTPPPATASARPEQGTAERATALVFEAAALANNNNCAAALEKLEAATHLVDSPALTYQRANCEASLGHYTRARKLCELALRGRLEGTAQNGASAQVAAQRTLEAVTKALARLRLKIEPAGACVRIDGRALEADPGDASVRLANTAALDADCTVTAKTLEILLDPGVHAVSISAPRRIPQTFELTSVRNEVRTYDVTLERNLLEPIGITSMTLGVASMLAGATFGVLALTKQKKSEEQCFMNQCSQEGLALNRQAQLWGNWSTGTLVTGGALVGIGTALWLMSSVRVKAPHTTVSLVPLQSGGYLGLHGAF
ncbi:MAG: hypothetical protein QM820_29670 [Minicystis sp.]